VQTPSVVFGETLQFSLSMTSNANHDQPLIIDYVVHHQKANGKTSPKVFKWRTTMLPTDKSLHFKKEHRIKKISTRVYYQGKHAIEIVVNGVSLGKSNFQLLIP